LFTLDRLYIEEKNYLYKGSNNPEIIYATTVCQLNGSPLAVPPFHYLKRQDQHLDIGDAPHQVLQ